MATSNQLKAQENSLREQGNTISREKNAIERAQYAEQNKIERGKKFETARHNRAMERQAQRDTQQKYAASGIKAFTDTLGHIAKLADSASENNPDWYDKNPKLTTSVASIPFNAIRGRIFSYATTAAWTGQDGITDLEMRARGPLAIAYRTIISTGISDGPTSPVNVAARKLLNDIQSKNSRTPTYASSDLMLYFTAVDNLFSFHAWITRLYGVARYYTAHNVAMPGEIFDLSRVNGNDVRSNLMKLWNFIITFAKRAERLLLPAGYPLALRHMQEYSAIYADDKGESPLLHFITPAGFYKFEWDTETKHGKLVYKTLGVATKRWTVDELIEYGEALLAPLYNDEDFGTMSSDIMRAFGSEVYTIAPVDMNYEVRPVYDELMLTQFANSKAAGRIWEDLASKTAFESVWEISQSTPKAVTAESDYYITFSPIAVNDTGAFRVAGCKYDGTILNFKTYNKTEPKYILEATRLVTLTDVQTPFDGSEKKTACRIIGCGSEILVDYALSASMTGDGNCGIFVFDNMLPVNTGDSSYHALMAILGSLSGYDYKPVVAPCIRDSSTGFVQLRPNFFMDWEKYGYVANESILQMHACALLSEYSI